MQTETPVTQPSPCYSAVSSSLTNPLPDCSNYSPFCHTYYFSRDSLWDRPFTKPLRWRLILHCCSALLPNLVGNSGEKQYLEEAEPQAEVSVDDPYPPLQIVNSLLFSLYLLSSLCFLSQSSRFSLSPFPSFSSDKFFVLLR